MIGQAWRRVVPLLAVGLLLAGAAVATSMSSIGLHRLEPRGAAPWASVSPDPSGSITSSSRAHSVLRRGEHPLIFIPDWVKYAVLAVIGAMALALVVAMMVHAIQNASRTRVTLAAGGGPASVTTRREAVLAAVDAGIEELASDDGDPRSAVILCWVRLEDIAATAGTGRAPGDSPTDLVTRLLRAHQVSASVLATLAEFYRTARYSRQEIPATMRDQARQALYRLRDELAVSRSGPLEGDAVAAPLIRPRPSGGGR